MKAHYKSFSPPWLLILIFKLLSAHFMQVKLRVYSGYLRPLWNHFPGIHWQCNCRLSNRLDTSNVPRCQMLWLDLEPVLWACFQPSYYMTTQQMVLIHPHNNRHPFSPNPHCGMYVVPSFGYLFYLFHGLYYNSRSEQHLGSFRQLFAQL